MTRTVDSSGAAGASSPKRFSRTSSRSSTCPAHRVGCLVSMAISTRRPASATSSNSRSSVRTEVSSGSSGRTSQSGSSVRLIQDSRFLREPKSRAASSASSRAETAPRPLDVRLTRRSWTHTRWPSAVRRTSHSRASAPSSIAFLYAARVCSGASSEAPRWATTRIWCCRAWVTASWCHRMGVDVRPEELRGRWSCARLVADNRYKDWSRTHSDRLWCSDGPWEKLTAYINGMTAGTRRPPQRNPASVNGRDRVRPKTTAVDRGEKL